MKSLRFLLAFLSLLFFVAIATFLITQNASAIRLSGGVADGLVDSVNGQTGIVVLRVAEWEDFTIDFSDFTAVAGSETIVLFALPFENILHGIEIKHSTAFTGGTITAYTIEVGIVGDTERLASAFDIFQAVSSTTSKHSEVMTVLDHLAAVDVTVTARSIGDTLNNAAAGSVVIRVFKAAP